MLPDDGGRNERPLEHDPAAYALLAATLGMAADAFEAEVSSRAAFLEDLGVRGICDPPDVADAVRSYQA